MRCKTPLMEVNTKGQTFQVYTMNAVSKHNQTITGYDVGWISFNVFALIIISIPWNLCKDVQ